MVSTLRRAWRNEPRQQGLAETLVQTSTIAFAVFWFSRRVVYWRRAVVVTGLILWGRWYIVVVYEWGIR